MLPIRLALIALVVLASSAASAQGIHKCRTPDGKTIFTDKPCESTPGAQPADPAQAQVPGPAAAPVKRSYEPPRPGSLNEAVELSMKAGCDKGLREACETLQAIKSGLPHGDAIELLQKKSCDRGDKSACKVYCADDDASEQCIRKTGKAAGPTWYEIGERSQPAGNRSTQPSTSVTIACRHPALKDTSSYFPVQCEGGQCRHTAVPGQAFRRLPTLEAAAADGCEQLLLAHKASTARAQAEEKARFNPCATNDGSVECLQKSGRASGAGWFEREGRGPSVLGEGQTDIPIVCRDVPRNAPKRAGFVQVTCRAQDTSCTHNREPSPPYPRYSSLAVAAADACSKASAAWQQQQRMR